MDASSPLFDSKISSYSQVKFYVGNVVTVVSQIQGPKTLFSAICGESSTGSKPNVAVDAVVAVENPVVLSHLQRLVVVKLC